MLNAQWSMVNFGAAVLNLLQLYVDLLL
eukprot:SAG31_NODE_25800_length_453_cov_14.384181_1_plen_27_part_10